MPYININPSIEDVSALAQDEMIILHPQTPIELATAFARNFPKDRLLLILRGTSWNLSCAVSSVLSIGATLVLDPTMSTDEGRAIVRSLNPGVTLLLVNEMLLCTRLEILGEVPNAGRVQLDPRILINEISETLQAIPHDQVILLCADTPDITVRAVAQNLKKFQILTFGNRTSESIMCTAARHLTAYAILCFHDGMPLAAVSAIPPNGVLLMPKNIQEAVARNVAMHIPSNAITIILSQHSENIITAIASELKPTTQLKLADDLPIEKILVACRALRSGTILKLGSCLKMNNSLRIARALNTGIVVDLDPRLSLELRANFIDDINHINQSFQLSLFPAAVNRHIRHTINERDLASIYTFIDYELNEHGTFYAGFNELEDTIKIPLLNYLIQKNTIQEFIVDPILELTAAELDGGSAIFNDLDSSIKKIAPLADIPEESMIEIKSKIILKLESLQKSVENKIISSFELS